MNITRIASRIGLIILLLLIVTAKSIEAQTMDSLSQVHLILARQVIDTGLIVRGTYGFGSMRHVDLVEGYADNRLLELHIGFRGMQSLDGYDIPGARQGSLFFGSATTLKAAEGHSSERTRFGARTAGGYGWVGTAGMFLPYTASSIVWSKLTIDDSVLAPLDRGILQDYNSTFRYGGAIEAGLELISENGIAINVGVERTLVFPRHLVFQEFLSSLIQGGVAEVVGMTSAKMVASRTASPIVSFVLSTAIRFGISELRRKDMNWPFTSAPPLVFDTFQMGLGYTF